MFPDWQSPWTWWGMALAMLPLLVVPRIWIHRKALFGGLGNRIASAQLSEEGAETIRTVFTALGALAFLAMMIVFLVSYESPRWSHPTLTEDEQERAKAECEMKAVEATEGQAGRIDYKFACLTAKGFRLDLNE